MAAPIQGRIVNAELGEPLVVHIHVPKCGGTSFCDLLDQIFPGGHHRLYFEPETGRSQKTTFVYSDDEIAQFVKPTSVKALSSHYIRRFPRIVSARPAYYITFLRDPLTQFISYLSYTRQVFHQIADPVLLSHLPPNMPELSLRECARWLLQRDKKQFWNFRDNYTTTFFARYEAESRYGFTYSDVRYRWTRLYVAKRVLRTFFFVGISELMPASMCMLEQKLRSLGLELPPLQMPHVNSSDKGNESLGWLEETDEIGRLVLRSMRADRRLYRWARRNFELQAGTL